MKISKVQNEITIHTGCFDKKEKIVLYDFEKLDHIVTNGVSYIRILCGNRFYYYKTMETTISEIKIYK